MSDTRARFLAAIADQVGVENIVELHLFSPIRQGAMETGVAVLAVTPAQGEEPDSSAGEEAECGAGEEAESGAGEGDDTEESPYAPTGDEVAESAASSFHTLPLPHLRPEHARLVVYTARYRLTRKGLDRGKWLFEVAATADAPLATVDAVARGVTQRSKDLTESERLSGDQLRALLGDSTWRTPK